MSRPAGILICIGFLCAAFVSRDAAGESQPNIERAPIRSVHELFDLFGFDRTFFQQFASGQAWSQSESEPLVRVLVRLPQIRLVDVERWTQRDLDWQDVKRDPAKYQRELVRLEGRLRHVAQIVLPAAEQERFALASYYRCEMTLGDRERTAIVFARNVPKKWPLDTPLDEQASANAVFLKLGPEAASGESELYFAADRVAWHPETLLGKLGMDFGLFDTVEQQRPITNQERECFFQLLAAAGRADAQDLVADTADPVSALAPLIKAPEEHLGELHSFRGVARRAVKIHVSDPDSATRFGFDHYFELVIFLELNGVLEVAGQKVRSYPVVFCVRELPSDMPTGENISEVVRASGFMFKKWRYATELTEERAPGLRMFSPLLIGKTVDWERRERAASPIDPIIGGVLAAAIVLSGLFVWWFRRRDRSAHDAVVSKSYALPAGRSLNDLNLDGDDIAGDATRR